MTRSFSSRTEVPNSGTLDPTGFTQAVGGVEEGIEPWTSLSLRCTDFINRENQVTSLKEHQVRQTQDGSDISGTNAWDLDSISR